MAERICAVVVTYNRLKVLHECLAALQGQTRRPDIILVVDNASTDGTGEYLSRVTGVTTLRLEQNVGGAGGFAAGMKWSREQRFDWVWVMDDDALPRPDALEHLEPFMNASSDQLLALASRLSPSGRPAPELELPAKRVAKALFVGFAVSLRVLDTVGFPRSDFFIYSDDSEYCLRIRNAGGEILQVPQSIVEHDDWLSASGNLAFEVAGRRLVIYPNLPPWKAYYLARNRLLIGRLHGWRAMLRGLAQSMLFLLLTLVIKPAHLGHVLSGLRHGLMGRSGQEVRPG